MKHYLAFNSAPLPNVLVGLAVNIGPGFVSSESEWTLLVPYGTTDYWREDAPGKWRKYQQVFERSQAEAMEAACNALRGQAGENWRGLPIYAGHPDANPERWPDDRRLGGILAVRAGTQGLEVQRAWNDRGLENKAQGYWVYPSPAWNYDQVEAARTGRIVPNVLISVGMTNQPRIPNVPAWTNSDDGPDDEATNQIDMKHKANLLKVLGLPEEATDDQLDAAMDAHLKNKEASDATAKAEAENAKAEIEKAAKEKADAEKKASDATTAANAEAKRFRDIAAGTLLDTAINDGRITASERPEWETKLATNFDDGSNALKAKKPALDTKSLNLRPTGANGDLSTPRGRSIAFNTAIDKHMNTGLTFEQAINAMKSNPEEAAIIASMNGAAK